MRRVAVVGTTLAVGALALGACNKPAETAAAKGEPAAATASAPVALNAPPKRKPGLWAHTIQSAGATQAMKVCIDADTDAKMSVLGQAATKEMCPRQSYGPTPGGIAFESECNLGGGAGTVVSKGSITGDFNSAYTVKASSTTTGSSMPQANGQHEMTLTARWEGPCPVGVKGGDMMMTMPDGRQMTINMEKMTGAMAGAGQK